MEMDHTIYHRFKKWITLAVCYGLSAFIDTEELALVGDGIARDNGNADCPRQV